MVVENVSAHFSVNCNWAQRQVVHSFCSLSFFSRLNGCASTLLYGSAVAVPFNKGYMEEWEKVDVGEVCALTTSKNEVATQDFQHSTTHEAHRDGYYRPKSSEEGTIDAPSWKYHGAQEDDVSWKQFLSAKIFVGGSRFL